jgi:hypothetical protein
MISRRKILYLLFFLLPVSLLAQDVNLGKGFRKDKTGQAAFFQAEELFDNENYLQALPFYRSLAPKYSKSDYLTYRIGICLLYKVDELDSALIYLQKVKAMNPKAADIDLFLARAYHLNEMYDEALAALDLYETNANIQPSKRQEAKRLREYCIHAKELSANPVVATITNLGEPVNTENSEYVPIITSDDSVMLFTYRGESSNGGLQSYPGIPDSAGIYFEDVFMTTRYGGPWSDPLILDSTINTVGHDACIAISTDGQTLLIYKDSQGNGDILTSTLNGFYWSAPMPLIGDVNSSSWEGSATFSSDKRTIYFASERPGGYGGRDIYVATLQADSTWGNVKNLGPKINTPYDEDAPFLHPNGVTLIFSSEGHNSMGGYDIFQTTLTPVDSTYSDPSIPVNLGYPINTPGDDKYFVLGTDGTHGYYSSGKKGGYGQQDIYLVESEFKVNSNVLLLNGTITYDGVPAKGTVTIRDSEGKMRPVVITSNPVTGRYLATLPQGKKYTVTFQYPLCADQMDSADGAQTGEMKRVTLDAAFHSPAVVAKIAPKDSLTAVFKHIPQDTIDLLLVEPTDAAMLLRVFGNAKSPGLIYRVQIAAYNYPLNYSAAHLKEFGKVDTVILDDHITRFTLGKFETYAEAQAYCQRVRAAGQTDAFVTAEKEGHRYLIAELIRLRFFQESN